MNLRNKATVLLLDQIDTVQVCFDAQYIEGLTKLYTYKVKKGYVQPGDMALVLNRNDKLKAVNVVAVDDTPNIDPYASYEYQWIFQRVDTSTYDKCIAAEDELIQWLRKSERSSLVKKVQDELKESMTPEAIEATTKAVKKL